MRILMVHNRYRAGTPGGEDAVVDAESRLLESAGHEVIRYERSNDEMSEDRWVDAMRTVAGLYHSRRTRRELSALIARHRPEVAHIHNTFPLISSSAHAVCAAARLPIVQTVHNYRYSCAAGTHYRVGPSGGAVCESCTPQRRWAAVRHRCYRGSLAGSAAVALMISAQRRSVLERGRVARFIALSEFAAERLKAAGVSCDRIVVRPNFVDELPAPYTGPRRHAVYSGRLSPEKGLRTLLEAWRNLSDLPLKVIGDGPFREALERQVREEGLNVEFLGMRPRSESLQLVREALLQVVPSEWFEGMPLVVLEAWGLEVPIVVSRIGSLIEMAGGDSRALTFPPGSAAELAAQVRRLQQSNELRAALVAAGRERVAREHSRERALASLLEIYRQARL